MVSSRGVGDSLHILKQHLRGRALLSQVAARKLLKGTAGTRHVAGGWPAGADRLVYEAPKVWQEFFEELAESLIGLPRPVVWVDHVGKTVQDRNGRLR